MDFYEHIIMPERGRGRPRVFKPGELKDVHLVLPKSLIDKIKTIGESEGLTFGDAMRRILFRGVLFEEIKREKFLSNLEKNFTKTDTGKKFLKMLKNGFMEQIQKIDKKELEDFFHTFAENHTLTMVNYVAQTLGLTEEVRERMIKQALSELKTVSRRKGFK